MPLRSVPDIFYRVELKNGLPTVSVIIPTHSRPQLLPKAVESARAAGNDVEIIVVDDASSDETASVCQSLSVINHIRLERNQGVAGARNVGIFESTGKYVAFLDDDDLRLPGSLDVQVATLEANPQAGFVCGAMLMADQDYHATGEVVVPRHSGGDVFWELLELDFPVMPLATLIRKECFLRVGLLNTRLMGIDDWDIFVRIAEFYPIIITEQPVRIYRQPTVSSGQGSSAQAAQLRRAAHHQFQLLKLPRSMAAPAGKRRAIRRSALNRIADTLLRNALSLLRSGEYVSVCVNILSALRLSPLRSDRPVMFKKLAKPVLVKGRRPETNRYKIENYSSRLILRLLHHFCRAVETTFMPKAASSSPRIIDRLVPGPERLRAPRPQTSRSLRLMMLPGRDGRCARAFRYQLCSREHNQRVAVRATGLASRGEYLSFR